MRKYRLLGYLWISLWSWSCSRVQLQHAFNHSSLSKQASGIYIQELESQKIVFEHHADHFFMPASNAKLLTFLMANRYLPTTIPNFKYHEAADSLFIWGVGDPSFLDPRFQNKALLDFMQASEKMLVLADSDGQIPPFGSGWAWLVLKSDQSLVVSSTPNQDNPLMDLAEVKGFPLLGLDVWEHAYYLKYQNKRPDYINSWWNLVNWDYVQQRYTGATQAK